MQTHQLCRHNLQPACQPIANLLEKRGLLHRVVQGHDEGPPVTASYSSRHALTSSCQEVGREAVADSVADLIRETLMPQVC